MWQGGRVPELADPTVETYTVCSVPIAAVDATGAATRIVRDAVEGRSCQVHLCNAYTLSLVDQDIELRAALTAAQLNLADGAPVALMGRRQGMTVPSAGASWSTRSPAWAAPACATTCTAARTASPS